jgi:phage FluMu protein Com
MEALFIILFWAFVVWICWRLFARNWVMSRPFARNIPGHLFSRKISEEAYYTQAAHEVKNDIISHGLWVKAWSDAQGDDTRAKALYIKYRFEDLRKQAASKFSEYAREGSSDHSKVVISCQQCGANLRVAAGKHLDIRCPKCGATFRTMTPLPSLSTSYGSHFARYIYAIGACIGVLFVFAIIMAIAHNILHGTMTTPVQRALITVVIVAVAFKSCAWAWKAIVKPNDE